MTGKEKAWRDLDTGFLNGLRAIAALTVLVGHSLIWSNWPEGRLWHVLPAVGNVAKMAVDLFMILSGFLMVYNSMQREHQEPIASPASWIKFYIRRYFRIAPAYYLSLFCAVVLAGPFLHGYSELADLLPWPKDFIYNGRTIDYTATNLTLHLSFLFGLFPQWAFSTQLPDWSLSLEMQFYAVFPFLAIAVARFGALRVSLVLAPICLLGTVYWHASYIESSLLLFKLPVFLSGMLLCYAALSPRSAQRLALNACAIALPLTQYPYYSRLTILISLAAALIAFLARRIETPHRGSGIQSLFRTALDNRLATFGSDISYSIYLFHGFVIALLGSVLLRNSTINALDRDLRSALMLLVVLLGTIPVAIIVHRYVERPGIELGRSIIARQMRRAAHVSSA